MVIIVLAGCQNAIKTPVAQDEQKVKMDDNIKDYGNGVYYFNYTDSDFGEQLSLFIGQHPELRMVSFASDNDGSIAFPDGGTKGYFVKFEQNDPCPCDTIKR